MSEPVRLALVAEGPTDAVVVEAALRAILGERDFVLAQLQPEQSEAFGPLGAGWGGVYRWCKQSALHAGGSLGDFRLLLDNYDLLIVPLLRLLGEVSRCFDRDFFTFLSIHGEFASTILVLIDLLLPASLPTIKPPQAHPLRHPKVDRLYIVNTRQSLPLF